MSSKKYKYQKGGNDKQLLIANGSNNTNTNTNTNTNSNSNSNSNSFVPIKRIPYDIQIFSFLCILGIIFRIIFAGASSDYATATVWGYGFSLMAMFGLIIGSFAISNKEQISQGVIGFFKIILYNSLPIIFTTVIIFLVIIQNIVFYDRINSGKVADEYYQFSGVSSFLILVQVSLVIHYIMDKLKSTTSSDKNKGELMNILASELNSIILILTMANISFVGMLQVILKFFSTDG